MVLMIEVSGAWESGKHGDPAGVGLGTRLSGSKQRGTSPQAEPR